MTPFLQFRMWLRRGPASERVAAGLAFLVFLALVSWSVLPVNESKDTSTAVATGTAPTEQPARSASGAAAVADSGAVGPTPGSVATLGSAAPQTAGSGHVAAAAQATNPCAGLRATDQGVSSTDILVAVPVINLGGDFGNQTFGVRGADDIAKAAQAAADGINAEGGVACRKLRIKTYKVNPIDPNAQRATCLQIIADKPFAVVDIASYLSPSARSCFIQAKIPYNGDASGVINDDELASAYPYMFIAISSTDRAMRNWVFESSAHGVFDSKNGFRKLGVLVNECNPKANAELKRNLNAVGVRDDQISVFTLSGCGTLNSPSEIGQAVLQHHNAGVTDVFLAGAVSNGQNYVRNAEGIGWKPTYLTSDAQNETRPFSNWSDSFDGAIGITSNRSGEINSGIVPPLWSRCNDWMKNAGIAPSAGESDSVPAAVCDQLRLFAAAANGAGPTLTRQTLVDGLTKVARFGTAGYGDALYGRRGKVSGGDFVRAIQWHLDCKCWKVLDRDMKPAH